MPHLTLDADSAGRAILEIFVTRGAAESESLGLSSVRPQLVRAMIDSGAGITIIERTILERLAITPIGEIDVHTVSSGEHPIRSNLYVAQLFFAGIANGVLASNLTVISSDSLAQLGVQMLLGRDVLRTCLFLLNGPENQFTLAF
jgi:hypothetical protein